LKKRGVFIKKSWLIAIIIISLTLNIIAAFLLYKDSKIIYTAEKRFIKQPLLDYAAFSKQWGKAWLGLEICDVSPEVAARVRLDRVEGALVKSVATNSPAQGADIKPGDVIVSFNGRKVRTAKQLQSDLSGSLVGTEVYMCVVKGDYTITVYVVPEVRPPHLYPVTKTFSWLGVKVSEVLTGSDQAKKLEEAGKAGGVLIEEVIYNSPAEKAGLQKGDVIMSFNSRKTITLKEFFSDLAGAEAGEQVRMCIIRDQIRKTIYVTLKKKPLFDDI
jgi:serine protease Do